eukprot:s6014_g5.t1
MTKLCLLNIFESAVTDSESRHTLKIESSLRILNLVQSNLIGLAPETNDLELLVPRHQEALWLRQLYATYYERHNSEIEALMHESQAAFTSEAHYCSIAAEQSEMLESEFYVWRVRSPGLLQHYAGQSGMEARHEVLAWHGDPSDLDQASLLEGDLRPTGRMLAGELPWRLAAQPLQTFGKGAEWTLFYLCLVRIAPSEMSRLATIEESGRVLPLYCLAHPSLWLSGAGGERSKIACYCAMLNILDQLASAEQSPPELAGSTSCSRDRQVQVGATHLLVYALGAGGIRTIDPVATVQFHDARPPTELPTDFKVVSFVRAPDGSASFTAHFEPGQ